MRQPTITFIYILLLSIFQFSLFKANHSLRVRIRRDLFKNLNEVVEIQRSERPNDAAVVQQLAEGHLGNPSTSHSIYHSTDPQEIHPAASIKSEMQEESLGNGVGGELVVKKTGIHDLLPHPQSKGQDLIHLYFNIMTNLPQKQNAGMKAMWSFLNLAHIEPASEARKYGKVLATNLVDFLKESRSTALQSGKALESAYPALMNFFENFYKAQLSTLPETWGTFLEGILKSLRDGRETDFKEIFGYFPNLDRDIQKAGSDLSAEAQSRAIATTSHEDVNGLEVKFHDPVGDVKRTSAVALAVMDLDDTPASLYDFWRTLKNFFKQSSQPGANRDLLVRYTKEMIKAGDYKNIKVRFPELIDAKGLPSSSRRIFEGTDESGIARGQEYIGFSQELKEFKENNPEIVKKEAWLFSDAVLTSPRCDDPMVCVQYWLAFVKDMKTEKGVDALGAPLARELLNKLVVIADEKANNLKFIDTWPEAASSFLRNTLGSFFDENSILEEKRISLLRTIHKEIQTFDQPEFTVGLKYHNKNPFQHFPGLKDVDYFQEARSRLVSGNSATTRFIQALPSEKYLNSGRGEDVLLRDLQKFDKEANIELSHSDIFWTQMIEVFEASQNKQGGLHDLITKYPNLISRLRELAPERKIARELQLKASDKQIVEKGSLLNCLEFARSGTSWICKKFIN